MPQTVARANSAPVEGTSERRSFSVVVAQAGGVRVVRAVRLWLLLGTVSGVSRLPSIVRMLACNCYFVYQSAYFVTDVPDRKACPH